MKYPKCVLPYETSIPFNLKLNPCQVPSLILKEHPEMHATNSVSERSGGGWGGGGGGANCHTMQELSVRVSWLCRAEATFFYFRERRIRKAGGDFLAVKMVFSCLAQTTSRSAFFI